MLKNSADRDEPAVSAYQNYLNNDFVGAKQDLNELEVIVGPSNKRIQHNKALVEFMINDMKNVEAFRKCICDLIEVSYPEVEFKDINLPFAFYNYAVLLYHSRYYYQAGIVLEKLLMSFKTIKDKKLIHHILVLLMEVCLCRRTADKTLEISKNHGELLKSNNELNLLCERLVCRAQLMLDLKMKAKLKPDSIENVFLIAHQHYLNNEYNESVNTLALYKTLSSNYDLKTQGEDIWAAINNNLGVIYLAMQKPYLATKYFQNAVKEHFHAMENKDSERLIACRDRPLYVHNLGLALLTTNKPEGAFECLVEAARHYPNNPCIWLRLAECCVRRCCSDEGQQYTVKKLGSGAHTRILLAKEQKEKYSTTGESFAIPSLSLEFAALCLRNAVTLLPTQDAPSDVNAPLIQAPPGRPISWTQRCYIKNSVLILQSYVLLQLQDPLAALMSANELLTQSDVSNNQKALAHIYAAEALINLDRISDAGEHLNPQMIHEIVSVLPLQMQDLIGVSVWAKAAVCHILKGDLVTARKILLQINSPRVLHLQVYLEMCTGNIENCHSILRKMRVSGFPS